MVPWNRIQLALMSPPPTPIRGTIVSREPESKHFAGATVDHEVRESAATASEHTVHVWRDGARLRVESNDGEPLYFCDGVHSWTPRSDRGWLVSPASPHGYHGPGRQILTVRGPAEWSDDDFTRPTDSPITVGEYLGRTAWNVELAPPPGKPAAMQLVVDAETGAILQGRNDHFASHTSFTEFALDESRDDDFYRWQGPAQTQEEFRAELRREDARRREREAQWFADNVTPDPITISVPVTLAPEHVRHLDGDAIVFGLNGGAAGIVLVVARRPRSSSAWVHPGGTRHARFWSTDLHDWAVGAGMPVHAATVTGLQNALHPGQVGRAVTFPTEQR